MSIKFRCPQCNKYFSVKDAYAGKKAKCPCGAKITIPTPVTSTQYEASVPTTKEPDHVVLEKPKTPLPSISKSTRTKHKDDSSCIKQPVPPKVFLKRRLFTAITFHLLRIAGIVIFMLSVFLVSLFACYVAMVPSGRSLAGLSIILCWTSIWLFLIRWISQKAPVPKILSNQKVSALLLGILVVGAGGSCLIAIRSPSLGSVAAFVFVLVVGLLVLLLYVKFKWLNYAIVTVANVVAFGTIFYADGTIPRSMGPIQTGRSRGFGPLLTECAQLYAPIEDEEALKKAKERYDGEDVVRNWNPYVLDKHRFIVLEAFLPGTGHLVVPSGCEFFMDRRLLAKKPSEVRWVIIVGEPFAELESPFGQKAEIKVKALIYHWPTKYLLSEEILHTGQYARSLGPDPLRVTIWRGTAKALMKLLPNDASDGDSHLLQRLRELRIALLKPGDVVTNSIGMKLVYIPPGVFMMGSPSSEAERSSVEGPQSRVNLSKGFWIGQYEVTQAQWQSVMGSNPSNFTGDNLPVDSVSWLDAVEFCRSLRQREGRPYRLPTEAEWEYACKAGSDTRFYYGNDLDYSHLSEYAWYNNNSRNRTHSVGQKKPNALGLYDMLGNVCELCSDWYDEDYYSGIPAFDPEGPDTGVSRVLRGGSWNNAPGSCRSAFRAGIAPDIRSINNGFRVVFLDSQK